MTGHQSRTLENRIRIFFTRRLSPHHPFKLFNVAKFPFGLASLSASLMLFRPFQVKTRVPNGRLRPTTLENCRFFFFLFRSCCCCFFLAPVPREKRAEQLSLPAQMRPPDIDTLLHAYVHKIRPRIFIF